MEKSILRRASSFLISALLVVGSYYAITAITCEPLRAQVSAQVYFNYTPPDWAPPYDNVSTVRYYYLPDYDMYYDVWERQFYYLHDGMWIATYDLPPMWAGVSLSSAFIVLIDRGVDRPWLNHDFYVRNYPHNSHAEYNNIVIRNRIITNIRPGHELVPRAYNENNRRVTFMQHQIQPPPAPGRSNGYHQQVHEVPMKAIAPSMPPSSRQFNYGGGQNRAPRTAPAPQQGRPQGGQPNKGGGGSRNKH